MDTTTKVGIGVAVTALVAVIAYVALRPKTINPLAPVAPPALPQTTATGPSYPSWMTTGQQAIAAASDGYGAVFGDNSDSGGGLSGLLGDLTGEF